MANIGVKAPSIQATAFLEVVKPAGTAFSAVQAAASCFRASNTDTPKEYLPPGCVYEQQKASVLLAFVHCTLELIARIMRILQLFFASHFSCLFR